MIVNSNINDLMEALVNLMNESDLLVKKDKQILEDIVFQYLGNLEENYQLKLNAETPKIKVPYNVYQFIKHKKASEQSLIATLNQLNQTNDAQNNRQNISNALIKKWIKSGHEEDFAKAWVNGCQPNIAEKSYTIYIVINGLNKQVKIIIKQQ